MRGIDAVLQQLDDGTFDLKIGFDGDLETDDFFDTAIIVSLFSDRRADESEVKESHRRRGWIGNERTPGFEMGSKLWLFEQSRLNRTVMNQVADAAEEALEWFVRDELAVAVRAPRASTTADGRLALEVELERDLSIIERRYFILWDATGRSF